MMTWFFIATVSALCSAASAIVQKKVLLTMNALEFSFLLSLAVAFLSSFFPLTTSIAVVSPASAAMLVGKSILSACAFLLVMKSLQCNEISSALPLLGLTPAAAAFFSLMMPGGSMSGIEWMGVGLMITGTTLLEQRPSGNIVHSWKRLLTTGHYYYAFGAVALFAVSSVADKFLVSTLRIEPAVVLFYQHAVYALFFLIMLVVQRHPLAPLAAKAKASFPLIALVALLTLAYRFTQLEAAILAPIALVLAVKRMSILYASFFGGKLFSEERLGWKLAGGALIVAAGFFILRAAG